MRNSIETSSLSSARSTQPCTGETDAADAPRSVERIRLANDRIGPDAFELMAIARVGIHPRLLAYVLQRHCPASQTRPGHGGLELSDACQLGTEVKEHAHATR